MLSISASKPKILILGGETGLLGQAISQRALLGGYDAIAIGREQFDPTNPEELASFIDEISPDIVCNTIGYTRVDQAEEEKEQAQLLNRVFPATLARIIKSRPSIHLMHFSTDFVFDGRKKSAYVEADATNPLNVYGETKRAGEQSILKNALEKYTIIRTAWLFGPGKKNFVSTMLDLCAHGKSLSVVHDQIGSPTYTMDLAAYCLSLYQAGGHGIYHIANTGSATWCELASESIKLAQMECSVSPVTSAQYPQKAVRPKFSVLDCSLFSQTTKITPRVWPQALREYIYTSMHSQ